MQRTLPMRRSTDIQSRLPLHHLPGFLLLLLLLFICIHLPIQNFRIQGHSMEPTLHDQEFVLVNKAAYVLQPPARGDIIVFQYPRNPQESYIKRIIAVPGDVISVDGQIVTVDGVRLQEPYVNKQDSFNPYTAIKKHIVGPNQYFVMGDNRGNSSDSRQWGLVPRDNILGKAMLIYWPPANNIGFLADPVNVFARVHQ